MIKQSDNTNQCSEYEDKYRAIMLLSEGKDLHEMQLFLYDDDPEIRRLTLNLLLDGDDEDSILHALYSALQSCCDELKVEILKILGRFNNIDIDFLVNTCLTNKNPEIRYQALKTIYKIFHKSRIEKVIIILNSYLSDKYEQIREYSKSKLMRLRNSVPDIEEFKSVRDILNKEDERIQSEQKSQKKSQNFDFFMNTILSGIIPGIIVIIIINNLSDIRQSTIPILVGYVLCISWVKPFIRQIISIIIYILILIYGNVMLEALRPLIT